MAESGDKIDLELKQEKEFKKIWAQIRCTDDPEKANRLLNMAVSNATTQENCEMVVRHRYASKETQRFAVDAMSEFRDIGKQ